MDDAYWKDRCNAAESALQRARKALDMTPERKAVVRVLADLKAGESIPTKELARKLHWPSHKVIYVLMGMHRVGLAERPAERFGGLGNQVPWRLGHMVQVEACE